MAWFGLAGAPVPSMSVKPLKTFTSAEAEIVIARKTAIIGNLRSLNLMACTCIFQNPLGAGGIEDAAGTESGKDSGCLFRGAAILLHKTDHLFRQRMADHAVTAHGGKHGRIHVGHFLSLALKSERIAHAVSRNLGILTALHSPIDRGRNIHA